MFESADLHFHSQYSDGKLSVDALIVHLREAASSGLRLAILTDHDSVASFSEYASGVKELWTPICASEISCTFYDADRSRDRELHLLVYGIDPQDAYLKSQFQKFKEARRDRFLKICENFRKGGYPLDGEALAKKFGGVLGRPHIADALIELGVVKTRAEAFDRFLHEGHHFFVPKWKFPLQDALSYAKKMNLRTSVAHPGQYKLTEKHLKEWKGWGLNGIECYHPRHSQEDTKYYLEVARRNDFLVTGGSDFHDPQNDTVSSGRLSLGRTAYTYAEAKKFLGDFLK